MNVPSQISTIIENQIRTIVSCPFEGLFDAPPIFFFRLAFPCKNRYPFSRDSGGGFILSGKNIARRPTNLRTKFQQCLNQHCGFNRHVQ